MAAGWSTTVANAILAAMLKGTSYAASAVYLQLHVGAPGAVGTANIAANNTRLQVPFASFGTPSGGSDTNTSAIGPWTATASETYTYVTAWDAATGGTFCWSGTITANAVANGDQFTIPASNLTITVPVAS